MGFAAIMIEKHTGRTVQLGDDDALGTVDDKRTVLRHQGDFSHVDILLFDVLDRLG